MKKVILTLVMITLACRIALADNTARTKELQDENQKLSAQIQQAQNFIQQAQVKIIGNNAVIEELKKQDLPEKPAQIIDKTSTPTLDATGQ